MGERAARWVALERAYVHEVYEQQRQHSVRASAAPWPRVARLLNHLEPGSLVCDVGCGNGKYLSVNPCIVTVGADRCNRLAEIAREKDNQVVLCDNLSLPFRDETFDACLSIAVVHHFATVERRVRAIRELARVLRIGGRLVISVWAMEQRNRKFESQDVLVPWHRPEALSTPSLELTSTTATSDDDIPHPPYSASNGADSDSCRGNRKKSRTKNKGKTIDPNNPASSSPSTSSLSSPNETCYSFVRGAIQKLAGGKRSVRPWFLDSWSNYSKEGKRCNHDYDDYDAEILDLPIELRRLDDEDIPMRRQTFACSETSTFSELNAGNKSKSLSDILAAQQKTIVRSRSSVPSLTTGDDTEDLEETTNKETSEETQQVIKSKPKLVKQKKSINEEDAEEDLDKPTDMKNLVKQLPEFKVSAHGSSGGGGVLKQSSLNEELMSTERLREKEKVRKNIQKQASLNEEVLYRRHKTLDSLRDSFFSTSATTAKKFQSLKNGLSHKFKTSTNQIEKATVNSFVRILQGWKSHEMPSNTSSMFSHNGNESNIANTPSADTKSLGSDDSKPHGERRHSKEDGSDSSKDSSLQSDTSVDSEDSFASVIFVPKSDPNGLRDPLSPTPLSPGPSSPRMKISSVPTSPRVKNAPGGLPSPRLKQLPLTIFPVIRPPGSPKATQAPPAISKMLTTQIGVKCSMPSLKDTSITNSSNPNSPPKTDSNQIEAYLRDSSLETKVTSRLQDIMNFDMTPDESPYPTEAEVDIANKSKELLAEINKDLEEINKLTAETNTIKLRVLQDPKPPYPKITLQTVAELPEIPSFKGKKETKDKSPSNENINSRLMDRKRRDRLKQIRELLRQRPGFASTSTRNIFPIVRRCSTQEGKIEPAAKPLPRLLSLELFNPETDDMDSDSSGVSSPDSVDSVINVKPEEQKSSKEKDPMLMIPPVICEPEADVLSPKSVSTSCQSLIDAAADVAHSLDETCEAIIQSSPRSKRKQLESTESTETLSIVHGDSGSSSSSNWSLNKLSPGDLRLLEERSRSHSHTSSSGSTSSLERLSPGRRSKERSPKQGSTSNSTWSLNKLSPIKHEGRSLEDCFSKCRRSPTKFPYDSMSLSSLEGDKNLIKSDSFSRLNANEKLIPCKSDIVMANEEEKDWNNECKHHLREFAEKLSEKLLHEIDQYSKRLSEEDFDVCEGKPNRSKKDSTDEKKCQEVLNNLSDELQKLEKLDEEIIMQPNLPYSTEFSKCTCKVKNFKSSGVSSSEISDNNVNTIKLSKKHKFSKLVKNPSLDGASMDNLLNNNEKTMNDVPNKCSESSVLNVVTSEGESNVPSVNIIESNGNPEITVDTNQEDTTKPNISTSLESGYSIESEISIESFQAEQRSSLKVGQSTDSSEIDKMEISPESITPRSSAGMAVLKPGFSVESSDAGDISGSGSDWSRRDTNSVSKTDCGGSTASLGRASTASLASCSDWSKERKVADGRSSSEETAPGRSPLLRQKAEDTLNIDRPSLQASLSDTSQDSLPSDNGGGAMTFHRYYHVFKEGELDQLIEKYVENLHIISSYYDHASWCVVAEKVQVWTI